MFPPFFVNDPLLPEGTSDYPDAPFGQGARRQVGMPVFIQQLVHLRTLPIIGRLAHIMLAVLGIEIPSSVEIGDDFYLVHRGFGVVIHPQTEIGSRVRVYPGVVIGRRDAHRPAAGSKMERIVIEDDVVLLPGAKVLGGPGVTIIGRGTVVGANALVARSTQPGEVLAAALAQPITAPRST